MNKFEKTQDDMLPQTDILRELTPAELDEVAGGNDIHVDVDIRQRNSFFNAQNNSIFTNSGSINVGDFA